MSSFFGTQCRKLMIILFSFPFGSANAKECLMGKVNFMSADNMLAEGEFKDQKIFGYFMMGQPILVINDEELAKKILIKDFEHFTDIRSDILLTSTLHLLLLKGLRLRVREEGRPVDQVHVHQHEGGQMEEGQVYDEWVG